MNGTRASGSRRGDDVRGSPVKRFTNEGAASLSTATKDVQTFSTRDKKAAEKWAKERADEGYSVTIHFEDGVYTCVAIK